MSNIIAIVGRPNVGKSTFFNRLIQRREAIVDSISGVTRDRHYGKGDWNGRHFSVIDTGGYVVGSDDVFESEIESDQISLFAISTYHLFSLNLNRLVDEGLDQVSHLVFNLVTSLVNYSVCTG